MPELPEVHTTVEGIRSTAVGKKITDVWTDLYSKDKRFAESIKNPSFFKDLKKRSLGAKIVKSERRAKNILIHLSNNETILVHMKMTGHMMYGKYDYNKKTNSWSPHKNSSDSLRDPYNRFVHFVISLNNGSHLVLCDSRKFAKVTIEKTDKIFTSKHLKDLGPEPLEKNFTQKDFKERISKKPSWPIKKALLDQTLVVGIGNIYSDEMLFLSGIRPDRFVRNIKDSEYKAMFIAMKKVLKKGIDFGGDSMSDYRNIYGERGAFQHRHNAYRRTGEKCTKKGCSGTIIRKVIAGRSSHYCDKHQK